MEVTNGNVKLPIVLRGHTELLIAQNAHNLVWQQHMTEWLPVHDEYRRLKKAGEPYDELERQRDAMRGAIQVEIDALVVAEIERYREARQNAALPELQALMDRVDELEQLVQEARDTAEDALSEAEDAQSSVEELEERIEALEARLEEMEMQLDFDDDDDDD